MRGFDSCDLIKFNDGHYGERSYLFLLWAIRDRFSRRRLSRCLRPRPRPLMPRPRFATRRSDFMDAFNKGDAKTVADQWAKDGDYFDETGERTSGREAIQKNTMRSSPRTLRRKSTSRSMRFAK